MARVFIPALLRQATEGKEWVQAPGATVRDVIQNLEAAHPKLKGALIKEDRLQPGLAVAIDGEISAIGLNETVTPQTEIQFLTAIQGGAG